ncbi:hypothetical protein LINGRAHAP2_LOCUS25227, partial [Linum grandiflorum]
VNPLLELLEIRPPLCDSCSGRSRQRTTITCHFSHGNPSQHVTYGGYPHPIKIRRVIHGRRRRALAGKLCVWIKDYD